jgi:astacin (peptidase family M12A)
MPPDAIGRVKVSVGTASVTRFMRVLVVLLAIAFAATTQATAANASVFDNFTRWPVDPSGYTIIPVCVAANSSVGAKKAGIAFQPSLSDAIGQVRDALRRNWEAFSSVRFVGWRDCSNLSELDRRLTVGLLIHPDAMNNAGGIGNGTKGGTARFSPWGTRFVDPGDPETCAEGASYRFACLREYAVHEFGHVIGFVHEMEHPKRPSGCKTSEAKIDPSQVQVDSTYNPANTRGYTIVNADYDYDSIMAYDPGCVDQTGVRFGSRDLDTWDKRGVKTVYPPPTPGKYDVGVIPNVNGNCPRPTEVKIFLDNEDSSNQNTSSGWTGAIVSGRNTLFEFCKVDGSKLGRLPAPKSGSGSYAVLRLGDTCPIGSTEFVRYHDDEDGPNIPNISWMAGEVGPTRQNGDLQSTGTEMHWCVFAQASGAETPTMTAFPKFSFRYGVVAASNFSNAEKTGSVYIDDEDSKNNDKPQSAAGVVGELMGIAQNTRIHLALVKVPPVPCELNRTC